MNKSILDELSCLNEESDLIVRVSNNKYNIIDTLIKMRKQKKISQKALAEKVGIKQTAVARIESMKVCPNLDTILNLLQALDCSLEVKEQMVPIRLKTINTEIKDSYKVSQKFNRYYFGNKVACIL